VVIMCQAQRFRPDGRYLRQLRQTRSGPGIELVAMLEAEGWKVWWDTSLTIGDVVFPMPARWASKALCRSGLARATAPAARPTGSSSRTRRHRR